MPADESHEPNAETTQPPQPRPRTHPRRALSLGHVLLAAFLALWFMLLSNLPLGASGLWGHVIYGEWILEHRSLPANDPVMPLAEGMKVVDTAWLSQVILAAAERSGGADWLSQLFALTGVATYGMLAWTLVLVGRSGLVGALGALAALAIAWFQSTALGPESFGALCFAILLWLIVSSWADPAAAAGATSGGGKVAAPRLTRLWIGVPLLFAVWANLDGSFVYGLAVLACYGAGRALDVGRQSRRLRAVADDRAVRRWLYLTELAAAATLLNPYGIDLPLYILGVSVDQPPAPRLVLWGATGLSYGLSLAMVLSAFWLSRRRASAAHLLLLLVFAAAAAAGVGRLAWYGPVFALVLVPYLAELWRHLWPAPKPASAAVPDDDRPRFTTGPSWHYSVICAILAWMAFALSPISASLMGRLPRTLGQLVGPTVPLALAGHLAANPPQGQIFNPMHWGHWLALEGPPGLKTFVTTDTRVIPRQVWGSYLRLVDAGYEWQEILGLYGIDTVIVDKIQETRLARAMRAAEGWTLRYDDNLAMVFVRTAAEGAEAPEPAAATGEPPAETSPAYRLAGDDGGSP